MMKVLKHLTTGGWCWESFVVAHRAVRVQTSWKFRQKSMLRVKRVHTDELREEVYALRYRAYLSESAIESTPEERFEDKYDRQPNHILWAITEHEKVIGSIRTTWFDPSQGWSIPEMDGYGDDFRRAIPAGSRVLSGNRFVTEPGRTDSGSLFAMLLLRHHLYVATVKADHAVAAVRINHLPFYKRILRLERVSEGKQYPGLTSTMFLTACEFKANIDSVYRISPQLRPHGWERVFLDEAYKDLWEVGLPISQ
jgi:hypothetical protein